MKYLAIVLGALFLLTGYLAFYVRKEGSAALDRERQVSEDLRKLNQELMSKIDALTGNSKG